MGNTVDALVLTYLALLSSRNYGVFQVIIGMFDSIPSSFLLWLSRATVTASAQARVSYAYYHHSQHADIHHHHLQRQGPAAGLQVSSCYCT